MPTRGEEMVQDAKMVLARVKALSSETFTSRVLAELIEPFASRVEYFLKSAVFPMATRRTTLYTLIEDLATLGARSSTVAALHNMRELYNDSKHNPDNQLNWRRCVNTLSGAVDALGDLAGLHLPAVDVAFEQNLESVVYVSFVDHYIGGETECGLFLPSDHWSGLSPALSILHIPMSSWDDVKLKLTGHPRYTRGNDAVGQVVWDSLRGEDDFLDAGVWQGDFRELLLLLSPFNDLSLEEAVIPFLARRNDLFSVGVAIICAAIDVARGDPSLVGPKLRKRILERAKAEYVVDLEAPHAVLLLKTVIGFLECVPAAQRIFVTGPAFRRAKAEQPKSSSIPVLLDETTFVWLIP